ncbi:hypothetical protein Glove_502g10 [Diversispora epigaea]|uniref:Uncharacterized protein n=1 Tax=Diversispora epigaea TaxID=1348612 RepID=A0A397GQI2_9GLOM|nr:hypothetical protein Glove_502g10 [Diversispora epigaea]
MFSHDITLMHGIGLGFIRVINAKTEPYTLGYTGGSSYIIDDFFEKALQRSKTMQPISKDKISKNIFNFH